jgi:hypothetical protein
VVPGYKLGRSEFFLDASTTENQSTTLRRKEKGDDVMCRTQVVLATAFWAFLAIAGWEAAQAQDGTAEPPARTWTSGTGHTITATLHKVEMVVQLKKEDGAIVSVPLEKLSEADQEFVKQWLAGARGERHESLRLPFQEDFSKFNDGDKTDWGSGAVIKTGADGRKWLVPVGKGHKPTETPSQPPTTRRGKGGRTPPAPPPGGQTPIGRDVQLPQNAYIEFDYNVRPLVENQNGGREEILSGISLFDKVGAKLRIEWKIVLRHGDGGRNSSAHLLRAPGGDQPLYPFELAGSDHGTVTIRKTGDTINVRVADQQLTVNASEYKEFTRFEVDLYKGANSMLSLTNFKIGKSQ